MRRLALLVSTLLAATTVVFFSASSASAEGPCSQVINDWTVEYRVLAHEKGTGFEIEGQAMEFLRYNPNHQYRAVRFVNYSANGKHDLLAKAGNGWGDNFLGQTGSIGAAPHGAWCSTVDTGQTQNICGYLGFSIGNKFYTTDDRCHH